MNSASITKFILRNYSSIYIYRCIFFILQYYTWDQIHVHDGVKFNLNFLETLIFKHLTSKAPRCLGFQSRGFVLSLKDRNSSRYMTFYQNFIILTKTDAKTLRVKAKGKCLRREKFFFTEGTFDDFCFYFNFRFDWKKFDSN